MFLWFLIYSNILRFGKIKLSLLLEKDEEMFKKLFKPTESPKQVNVVFNKPEGKKSIVVNVAGYDININDVIDFSILDVLKESETFKDEIDKLHFFLLYQENYPFESEAIKEYCSLKMINGKDLTKEEKYLKLQLKRQVLGFIHNFELLEILKDSDVLCPQKSKKLE